VKAKTKTKTKAPAVVVAESPLVEVAAGYGFRAVIHDGYLQIQQADNDGNISDTIVLSKVEANRLFVEFGSWAA
jgi:hypothetical protein